MNRDPKCGAVIEWRQFQGMLLLTAVGYTGRCPVSHREIVQKKRPRLGATCGLPASMCRGPEVNGIPFNARRAQR